MASAPQIAAPDAARQIRRVQAITIAWMSVEATVSLFSAGRAHSPAMLAFGGDSAVELLSATVVLWRFRTGTEHEWAERLATRIAGALLFALAAFVALTSALSLLGYGRCDSITQSALCAYLSVIALAGLVLNAVLRLRWADPVAALVILPLVIWEGRAAIRGKPCACC